MIAFDELAAAYPDTRITWLLRRGAVGDTFGGGESDQLAARGALGLRAKAAVDAGWIEVVTGFRAGTVERTGDRLTLVPDEGRKVGTDEVVVLTR